MKKNLLPLFLVLPMISAHGQTTEAIAPGTIMPDGTVRVACEGKIDYNDYFESASAQTATPDAQGFIRRWHILDPIKNDVKTNIVFTDSYVRQMLDGPTAALRQQMPRNGQRTKMGKEKLQWHAVDSRLYNVKLFRFASLRGKAKYGVTFNLATEIAVADTLRDVRLSVGTNGASMWWIDGREVLLLSGDRRMVVDDALSASLTLSPGRHIIQGAVINGPGMSDACVRLVDSKGRAVTNYTIPKP